MIVQYIIIDDIIATAIGYAAYKIYETISNANSPCGGCKGCSMGEQQPENDLPDKKKPTCDHKM